MNYRNLRDLEEDYSKLCKEEKYREALDLLEEGIKHLPSEETERHYYKIMLDKSGICIKCDEYDKSIEILGFLIDKGYICPLHHSIYNSLRKFSLFAEVSGKNDMLREQVQKRTQFMYNVYLPEGYSTDRKYPLFLALHGDGEDMKTFEDSWKPNVFLKKGFIVVYVQSSQILYHNSFAWLKRTFNVNKGIEKPGPDYVFTFSDDDVYWIHKSCYEDAYSDMQSCFNTLVEKYSIDEDCILIGGMSGGATASIDYTMADVLPVRGFITLCPELKPVSFTRESVQKALTRGVRGVIMEGEIARIIEDENKMMNIFNSVRFPYEFYVNKGIGHDYPLDFDEKLEQALRFILKP